MPKVVVIGGGWAGCAASISAKKAGCEVVLLERTDLLIGLGNVGGIMRNNGRYTACEEAIALGATRDYSHKSTEQLLTSRTSRIDFTFP